LYSIVSLVLFPVDDEIKDFRFTFIIIFSVCLVSSIFALQIIYPMLNCCYYIETICAFASPNRALQLVRKDAMRTMMTRPPGTCQRINPAKPKDLLYQQIRRQLQELSRETGYKICKAVQSSKTNRHNNFEGRMPRLCLPRIHVVALRLGVRKYVVN
jgi:hypothetical protein